MAGDFLPVFSWRALSHAQGLLLHQHQECLKGSVECNFGIINKGGAF